MKNLTAKINIYDGDRVILMLDCPLSVGAEHRLMLDPRVELDEHKYLAGMEFNYLLSPLRDKKK